MSTEEKSIGDYVPIEGSKGFDVREYYTSLLKMYGAQIKPSSNQADTEQSERYKTKIRIVENVLVLIQGNPSAENLRVFAVIEDSYLTPFTTESHGQSDEGEAALKIATYLNGLPEVK